MPDRAPRRLPALALRSADPAALAADVLVVGVRPSGRRGALVPSGTWPTAAGKRLRNALSALGATGKPQELTRVAGSGIATASEILAVGLGEDPGPDDLRRAAGVALRASRERRRVALVFPDGSDGDLGATAMGALLGAYSFDAFRGAGTTAAERVASVTIVTARAREAGARRAVAAAETVAAEVVRARDLVNTPPSALPPAALATAAAEAVAGLPVKVRTWSESALAREGFGGILAVGQGSANPPRLVRLEYAPKGARRTVAFVGKGITFDSGGLSLKPPKSMETMKCDMSGAAAVIGAVAAIARLGLRVRVVGWVPTAENMPGGRAQRPGDVITIRGGRTVEVLNTDAEGRLILADALVRASEESPDLIVDIATLTGAQVVALGDRTAGVMGNDDAVRDAVWAASARAGETMWHMPIPRESRGTLDSAVADIKNIGDGKGGMLSAAAFLRDFIPAGTPWVHLDIAGPAFNDGAPYDEVPKGGTGVAVRTLVEIAREWAGR